ncbi:hypothetical protein ACQ4PT_049299 [Festuca glaucescens]
MELMEENGWSLPAVIGRVVEKLHVYLGSRSDSGKFKGTMKMLDLLKEKRDLFCEENLRRVNIDREEDLAAWLRLVKVAADDAVELVIDMEAETAGNPAGSDYSDHLRLKYIIGKLVSVCAEGECIVDVPNLESVQNDNSSDHAANLKENASNDDMDDRTNFHHDSKICETKYLPHDEFLVGRDNEIAIIRDMVLDSAEYVATVASLQSREQAENLHRPQKDWITEVLQNMDASKNTEVLLQENKMTAEAAHRVEYTRLAHDNTVANLRNPKVIPIVGIGGVGKSALARFIFQDGSVQEHFHGPSAWVYVTDRISHDEMIKQIIFSFGPKHALPHLCDDMKDVRTVLQRIIEGKRFFLVLDDVWSEIDAVWSGLRSVLRDGAPGSVVLVTTRFFGVASSIGTTGPIVLDPLQYDDSWALLKHYVFSNPFGSQSIQALEPISRKIADRLHGLPLAVKLVSASLRINLEESHWEKFLQGWWWNNRDDNLSISTISSLGSCYCELIGNMRQCFIFCSIFPRNYVFQKLKLVQMWIANGFVQLNSNTDIRRLEDIAGEWFDELVNRAFLQPSACKTGYIMHDLVRDFASALASNEYNGTSDDKLIDISQIRYLSIEMGDITVQPAGYKQLRTLMVSGDSYGFFSGKACYDLDTVLKGVASLRMLDFSSSRWSGAALQFFGFCAQNGYNLQIPLCIWTGLQTSTPYPIREFHPLDAISGLKYLRHLDLSFTGINRLPNSICSLCHLQVLCLLGCIFHSLPGNMNSLINLRHLYARSDTIAQICGIGKLTKLQELHEFRVKEEDGHRITELRNLNDIRGSLCISNLDAVTDHGEEVGANIIDKVHLKILELKWLDKITWRAMALAPDLTTGVLGGSSAPRNLQEVKLFGYPGNVLPNLVVLLKHVRVMEISSCSRLYVLPPLEQFEHLQKLKLHKLPFIKDINFKVYGPSDVVFKSLEELSFEDMEEWESWTCAGGKESIPNLRKLQIFQCHKLRKVPFKSLGTCTEEIFLEQWWHANAISGYLRRLTGLTRLEIQNSLQKRSGGILKIPCEQLTCLEYLCMKGFREVQMEGGLWHLRKIRDLRIFDCLPTVDEGKHILTWVPTKGAHVMHSLTHLTLSGRSLSTDLRSIFLCKIPSLRTLCFEHTSNFPGLTGQWLRQLSSLEEMSMYWCHTLPSSLGILSSLKKLTIKTRMKNYSIPPNSIPCNLKELQIRSSHIELEARCLKPNEEVWPDVEKMAKSQRDKWQRGILAEWHKHRMKFWLRNLLELKNMSAEVFNIAGPRQHLSTRAIASPVNDDDETAFECMNTKPKPDEPSIEDQEHMSNIKKERARWLREEKQRLLKLKGIDWPNIAHVPYIRINGNIIQNLYS